MHVRYIDKSICKLYVFDIIIYDTFKEVCYKLFQVALIYIRTVLNNFAHYAKLTALTLDDHNFLV